MTLAALMPGAEEEGHHGARWVPVTDVAALDTPAELPALVGRCR